jgi:hypothetical protein
MAIHRRRTDPIPLRDAAWQFAPQKMRREAEAERSRPSPDLPRRKFRSPESEALISVLEQIGDMAAAAADPREPTPAMKALLLNHLQTAKILAFGVQTKPDIGLAPQAIPVHLFKGKPEIDWRLGTIQNLGQRYEIVEVTHEPATSNKPKPVLRVKRGRQRVDLEISASIDELIKQRSFEGLIEKQKVDLIRSRCRERYPDRFPTPTRPSLTKIREVLKSRGD